MLAVVKLLIAFVVLGVLVVVILLVAIVPVVMLCVVTGAWVAGGFMHSLSVHGFFKPHFGDGMPVNKRKEVRLRKIVFGKLLMLHLGHVYFVLVQF